jgi:hypothetical protein
VECVLPLCRPDIFVALKALATSGRDKFKDAYDIDYVMRRDPQGPSGLGSALCHLSGDSTIDKAVGSLRKHYAAIDGRGPSDVANLLGQKGDN